MTMQKQANLCYNYLVHQDTIRGDFVTYSGLQSQCTIVGEIPVLLDLTLRCLGGHAGDQQHGDFAFMTKKRGVYNKVSCTCDACGGVFFTFPSQTRRFCNNECYQSSRGGKATRNCLNCGNDFDVYQSDIDRGSKAGLYCSKECRRESGRVDCVCQHCGKVFIEVKSRVDQGRGKYCSLDCMRAATPLNGGSVQRECAVCGKMFYTNPYILRRGYGDCCSRKCGKTGERNPQWVGGHTVEYPPEWTKKLRREIHRRDNWSCQLCGAKSEDIHHIDYNKNNCNHSNLIALCHSCHAKTNTRRKQWLKKFAAIMKQKEI